MVKWDKRNMNWKKPLKEGAAFVALVSLGIYGAATLADDVAVKKNPDGTVEAYDKPSTPPPASRSRRATSRSTEPPEVHIHYRLKNDVGTRRINGVTVRTNPDGSIDATDGESAPERMSGSGGTHKPAVHKKPVTKHK
jgi:hypothetical protein